MQRAKKGSNVNLRDFADAGARDLGGDGLVVVVLGLWSL